MMVHLKVPSTVCANHAEIVGAWIPEVIPTANEENSRDSGRCTVVPNQQQLVGIVWDHLVQPIRYRGLVALLVNIQALLGLVVMIPPLSDFVAQDGRLVFRKWSNRFEFVM
jgi:hypothetical protein